MVSGRRKFGSLWRERQTTFRSSPVEFSLGGERNTAINCSVEVPHAVKRRAIRCQVENIVWHLWLSETNWEAKQTTAHRQKSQLQTPPLCFFFFSRALTLLPSNGGFRSPQYSQISIIGVSLTSSLLTTRSKPCGSCWLPLADSVSEATSTSLHHPAHYN